MPLSDQKMSKDAQKKGWFTPIRDAISRGISAHSLGVSFAVALVAGVFPVATQPSHPTTHLRGDRSRGSLAQIWGTQSLVALPLGFLLGGNVAVLARFRQPIDSTGIDCCDDSGS
jgi:hypothetical protein